MKPNGYACLPTLLVAAISTSGCSSQRISDDAEKGASLGRVASAITTTFTADSAAAEPHEVVVDTGVGVPGSGAPGNYPFGLCFFTRLRGGFGGRGDWARIVAYNNQWRLSAANANSLQNGPAADIRCVYISELYNGSGALTNFSAYFYGDVEAHPPAQTFAYLPDVPNGATPIDVNAANFLATVDGRIDNDTYFDKASLLTSGTNAGAVFVKRQPSFGTCTTLTNDPQCFLIGGGWSVAWNSGNIQYTLRDVSTSTLQRTDTHFCFLTSVANKMSATTNSAAIVASGSWWTLVVSSGGTAATASCIPYDQS